MLLGSASCGEDANRTGLGVVPPLGQTPLDDAQARDASPDADGPESDAASDAGDVTPGPDLSVEGFVIPDPSRTTPGLFVTPARPGQLNGAGPFLNAYAAADVKAKCSNSTPSIQRLWQHNITFATYAGNGNNDYPYMQPGEAMTWRFVAPAEGTAQLFQYFEGSQVRFVSGFMSVSTKPCDFDVHKLEGAPQSCYQSAPVGLSVYYRSTNGAAKSYECALIPGKTYYLNLRMQDARPATLGGQPTEDSCAASGVAPCGGYVQIR